MIIIYKVTIWIKKKIQKECWYISIYDFFLSFLAKIEYRDIIGIDEPPDEGKDTETIERRLFYIHPTQKENKLEKMTLHIKATKTEMLHLWSELKDKINKGKIKFLDVKKKGRGAIHKFVCLEYVTSMVRVERYNK